VPFERHGNHAFTVISVVNNAPQASGVYGLADMRQWIYVGEAVDIQAELLRHLHRILLRS
jgi:excinuclease UvrABC nuclease subunit